MERVLIPKTWRSEFKSCCTLAIAAGASLMLSWKFPGSVIRGELFSFGSRTLMLHLPLFWLVPAGMLLLIMVRIYDVRYQIDANGLEGRHGILSLRQRIVRVRFEDIRLVETDQTLLERFLDVGTLEVGTAGTSMVELIFDGIGAPHEVRKMILAERDRRTARQGAESEPSGEMREAVG